MLSQSTKPVKVTLGPMFDEIWVQDGKPVEHWGFPEGFTILRQLGRLPSGKAEESH